MDYEFSSKEELYQRIKPALSAKLNELKRLGYSYIHDIDIWNYLIQTKWCKSKDLMLSDIVDDIFQLKEKEIDSYLKEKISNSERTQYFDSSLENL